MMSKRNNYHHLTKLIIGVIFLCFISVTFLSQTVSAYPKLTKNQIQLISDFTLDNKANAGGTITSNYYVFPDTKGLHGGPGVIRVVDRKTCKVTDKVKIGSMYLSGLYNKAGTNYITLIGMGSQKGCYKLNGSKLQKASGCSTPPGRTLIYQGTGQGNTVTMNGYTFKIAGFTGGRIRVWKNSGGVVATYDIPKSVVNAEPENIAIDSATGELWINYTKKKNGKRHSLWYKIKSSVFSKYTGKKGSSNPTKCNNSAASSEARTPSKSAARKKTASDYQKDSYTPSVSTYDGVVSTIFFGTIQDDGEGCGVYTVLDLVMTILTIGIGVTALIGITISGITYLTAKDNVEKTTKAKRRIFEIVIGLVAYAAIWGILTFLLPEFNPELKTCTQSTETTKTTETTESA